MAIVRAVPDEVMDGSIGPNEVRSASDQPEGGGYGAPSAAHEFAGMVTGSREYRMNRAVPIDEVLDPKAKMVTPMLSGYDPAENDMN